MIQHKPGNSARHPQSLLLTAIEGPGKLRRREWWMAKSDPPSRCDLFTHRGRVLGHQPRAGRASTKNRADESPHRSLGADGGRSDAGVDSKLCQCVPSLFGRKTEVKLWTGARNRSWCRQCL
eukprot:3934631-Prymnesium_polylepis.1